MYGSELLKRGIYGIVDTDINKVVYIGSTNTSFLSRWGYHANNLRFGTHCNKNLVKLFESGNFEFIILETGTFTSKELLEKEKEYTSIYSAVEDGYCIHVGGGKLTPNYMSSFSSYKEDESIIKIREYIETNWFNKKIYAEDKVIIEKYLTDNNIKVNKFMCELRRLGFVTQRFADKRSWLITEKTY